MPPFSNNLSSLPGPIGVFDSGYGGLTVLREIMSLMPGYDYLYLGDNARAPYGSRSFECVYEFTRQCVGRLFSMGCHLVVLACNTASAKALRTIQQHDLPLIDPHRRVLGVVRPTAESIGHLSQTAHVGIVATQGTIRSHTYQMEIAKFWPHLQVTVEACPMWVPLVENNEHLSAGADYFVQRHLDNLMRRDPLIDTLLLGCTHYPLLLTKIRRFLPSTVKVMAQGGYVARSLSDYLNRHPEMESRITCGGTARFLTTEQADAFSQNASLFLGHPVQAEHIML